MSSDIVARLRGIPLVECGRRCDGQTTEERYENGCWAEGLATCDCRVMYTAADEIERLRTMVSDQQGTIDNLASECSQADAEIERLRDELHAANIDWRMNETFMDT